LRSTGYHKLLIINSNIKIKASGKYPKLITTPQIVRVAHIMLKLSGKTPLLPPWNLFDAKLTIAGKIMKNCPNNPLFPQWNTIIIFGERIWGVKVVHNSQI
jgi:hypothetical protein